MAVELKKFQAEFKKIEEEIVAAYGEWKSIGDSQGNTKKLTDGARLAIGDRIGELKKQGAQGATLADFQQDAKVKSTLETIKTALSNFKAMEARKKTTWQSFGKIQKELKDLGARIDTEIADRKKKLFEPKSLPDMIKLGKTVHDTPGQEGGLKTQSINDICQTKFKDGEFEARVWADLDLEVKKGAAFRANAAVAELQEMFKPRLMKLRSDRVRSLAQELQKICTDATTARKSGDLNGAKVIFKDAVAKSEEMHGIVEKYNKAYTGNKSFLEGNPDFSAITSLVQGMASLENKTLKAVHDTQSLLK